MSSSALIRFLQQVRGEVMAGLAAGQAGEPSWAVRRVRIDVALAAESDAAGVALRPATVDSTHPEAIHRLTIECEGSFRHAEAGLPAPPGKGAGVPGPLEAMAPEPALASAAKPPEAPEGGDEATLRRRLELVLGGPPGFTTGARAEILADLLREFGRPMLIEVIQREWVTQFDTGPSASPSVTDPESPDDRNGTP